MPFFQGASDFDINGGTFYEVNGNQNNHRHDNAFKVSGSGNTATYSPNMSRQDNRTYNVGYSSMGMMGYQGGMYNHGVGGAFPQNNGQPGITYEEYQRFLAWQQQGSPGALTMNQQPHAIQGPPTSPQSPATNLPGTRAALQGVHQDQHALGYQTQLHQQSPQHPGSPQFPQQNGAGSGYHHPMASQHHPQPPSHHRSQSQPLLGSFDPISVPSELLSGSDGQFPGMGALSNMQEKLSRLSLPPNPHSARPPSAPPANMNHLQASAAFSPTQMPTQHNQPVHSPSSSHSHPPSPSPAPPQVNSATKPQTPQSPPPQQLAPFIQPSPVPPPIQQPQPSPQIQQPAQTVPQVAQLIPPHPLPIPQASPPPMPQEPQSSEETLPEESPVAGTQAVSLQVPQAPSVMQTSSMPAPGAPQSTLHLPTPAQPASHSTPHPAGNASTYVTSPPIPSSATLPQMPPPTIPPPAAGPTIPTPATASPTPPVPTAAPAIPSPTPAQVMPTPATPPPNMPAPPMPGAYSHLQPLGHSSGTSTYSNPDKKKKKKGFWAKMGFSSSKSKEGKTHSFPK